MKKLMLLTVALVGLSGGALFAQNATGTWQGTLQAGKELRIVIKISSTDRGELKAVMYNLDQGGQPIPAAIKLQGSIVKISVPGVGGTYQGTLSEDGTSISGTWAQGDGAQTLNLKRASS